MRVAWFAPRAPAAADPLDDTASLVAELLRRGAIDVIELYDERRAADFVWQHARQPPDICVFDVSDRPHARFVWPYALHYPGILRLRTTAGPRRTRPGLTTAIAASRLTVAGDRHAAASLAAEFPHAHIRYAPIGVAAPGPADAPRREVPLFASAAGDSHGVLQRAARRARDAGSRFDLHLPPARVAYGLASPLPTAAAAAADVPATAPDGM